MPGRSQDSVRSLNISSPDASIATVRRIRWDIVAALVLIHGVASLAFLPWFFSWTGFALALVGIYVFGTLGINLGYHRLLTHRGLVCPRWFEYTLAILGTCCAQESPPIWVATHRRHHQTSDSAADPHSPLGNAMWGYVGWLLVKQNDLEPRQLLDRYARDIMRDPFYDWLHRGDNWIKVVICSWLIFFACGFLTAFALGSGRSGAIQFGFSVMTWCAPCWCCTSRGWPTRWITCGAIATTTLRTTAATIYSFLSLPTERVGTTIITPTRAPPITATSRASST
jgi:fatty-acid desaturase